LGNPFIGRAGADEIWAYGFRNPYRLSFDRLNGNLVLGDVGQKAIEEVDVVKAGRNYGWPIKEGSFLFNNGGAGAGFVTRRSPGFPAGLVDPVLEYDHAGPGGVRQGLAVVGGYVYRGFAVTALRGQYVFGDYSRAFAQPSGRLFVGRGSVVTSLSDPGMAVFGFAQDSSGELYVLGNKTGVLSGSTGTVLRITGLS
jgi:glucose/arabinose dehydrogenase